MNNYKKLALMLGTWFALFGGIWVILDPLGGMDALVQFGHPKAVYFTFAVLLTLVLALLVVLAKDIHPTGFHSLFKETADLSGIVSLGSDRTNVDYRKYLLEAKGQIRILGLSLPLFASEGLIATLRELVLRGVQVRILMMNPFSPALDQRPSTLYRIQSDLHAASVNTLAVLHNFHVHLGTQEARFLKIAVLNVLPGIGLIAVDNQVLWNPYVSVRTGASSPYIMVNEKQSKLGQIVIEHFEELWDHEGCILERTLNLNDLLARARDDLRLSRALPDETVKKIIARYEEIVKP